MKATFSNSDYVWEHGKQPRGVGNWAFATSRRPKPEEIFWHHGTLAEAKKAAAKHFGDAFMIYVLA